MRKSEVSRASTLLLRELVLSVFVLFFRLSRWHGIMKARTAASGVSFVEGAAILGCWIWIEVGLRNPIITNRWVFVVLFMILYLINEYLLVDLKCGIDFEAKFSEFSEDKQVWLYAVSIGIVLGVALSLYFSVSAYRQLFSVTLPR